jgi:hypothetical protein
MNELTTSPELEAIINHACDMEIPRESSVGSGISIGDKWTEEKASSYKEKQWEKLIELYNQAKGAN